MGVRLLAFTAAAGASDAVLARLDALGAEKRAGRWRTHAVYLHPRNEAHGLRCAHRGRRSLRLLAPGPRPPAQPRPPPSAPTLLRLPRSDLFMVHFDEQPHAQYLISGGDGSGKVVMHAWQPRPDPNPEPHPNRRP